MSTRPAAFKSNCHQGATADEVYTPAPNWVLHFSYGLIRFLSDQPSTSKGYDLEQARDVARR